MNFSKNKIGVCVTASDRAERWFLWRKITALILTVACVGVAAGAQTSDNLEESRFEISPSIEQLLVEMQEEWLNWIDAYNLGDAEVASGSMATLLRYAAELGMERLPDASLAVAQSAVESARQGDFRRAAWVLGIAETLDPGRAETAFARAKVAGLQKSYLALLTSQFVGYSRLLKDGTYRTLWVNNLTLWAIATILLSGMGFIAMQMLAKGRELVADLVAVLNQFLPPWAAYLIALALLIWPILMPAGLLWMLIYWAGLLLAYSTSSERLVFALLFLFLISAPALVDLQRRQVVPLLSPAFELLRNLESSRLQGDMFGELGRLRQALGDEPALAHLIADVHREVGQWELARSMYQHVLDLEPANATAQVDLGNFYFRREDFDSAKSYYQQAMSSDPGVAEAVFNLSQIYSATYAFSEAETTLNQARSIDDGQVTRWIQRTSDQRFVTAGGGFRRIDHLRRQLREQWRSNAVPSVWVAAWRRPAPLAYLAVALLAAGGVTLAVSKFNQRRSLPLAAGLLDGWNPAFLPGYVSARDGLGVQAFLAIVLPMACCALLFTAGYGYRIPLGGDPGRLLPWGLAAVTLLGIFLMRWRAER